MEILFSSLDVLRWRSQDTLQATVAVEAYVFHQQQRYNASGTQSNEEQDGSLDRRNP